MEKEKKTTKTKEKVVVKKEKKETKEKEESVEMVKSSVSFSLVEVIFIVLITGIAVSIASGLIVYKNYDKLNKEYIASDSTELKEFVDHYNKILNNYVEEVEKDKLIEAAISGMYNYVGDEYTMYIDTDNTSDLDEQLNGEYTGIGVEIMTKQDEKTKAPYVEITKIFENTPAEEAGLQVGDIILKVDDTEMTDSAQVSDTIKKGNKETYNITYKRNGVVNTLTLTRKKVFINSVWSKTYGNVGYIKLDTFSARTASQVTEKLNAFDKNVSSLVIDLRGNTGGYLDAAYEVSELFVDKGKVIYQIKDREGKITKYKATTGVYRNFKKIVVLIDGGSASASEITALALKESAGAIIVGVQSYGKGTVQETNHLSSGALVKYTVSYWLSPNGNSINKVGITPDKEVIEPDKQLEEGIKAAK
jgi:carboxyl-terminal processing protease